MQQTQDKALRRISELKEQGSLDQKAQYIYYDSELLASLMSCFFIHFFPGWSWAENRSTVQCACYSARMAHKPEPPCCKKWQKSPCLSTG